MSAVEARYGVRPTPRTEQSPRAFTGGEFARGAAFALLWFQPIAFASAWIASLASGAEPGFVIVYLIFGFPLTLAATLAGSPLALVLGRVLRRQRRDLVHVLSFALYGAAWGYAVQALVFGFGSAMAALTLAYTIATSIAVAGGWWTTSRIALARDRQRRQPQSDVDALLAADEE